MSNGVTRVLARVLNDLRRLTGQGSGGLAEYPRGAARIARRDVDEKVPADQRGEDEVDKAVEALSTPEQRRAAPLDSRAGEHGGSPATYREYSLDEYIRMLEEREGRAVSPERRKTLRRGCVGLVQDRIGRTDGLPPMHIAFGDVESHGRIADLGKALAHVEAAEKDVLHWQRQLDISEDATRKYGTRWSAEDPYTGITRNATENMEWIRENLDTAQENARTALARVPEGHNLEEMKDAKSAAKLEGNRRVFDRVSGYLDELNKIFAANPGDAAEVARLIQSHPDLGPLQGIERFLPTGGRPEEFEAVITYKDLWSGQKDSGVRTIDLGNGAFNYDDGTDTPDPSRFRPNPETGRVDMSRDLHQGRPNSMNFNYAYYDRETNSWWGADQGDHDPNRPMRVKQMTPEYLWADRLEYDTPVFGVDIVDKSR